MKRRKEVEEAIEYIANETSPDVFDTLLSYIQSLEMMVDTAYKTLEELDEIV